VKIRETEVSDTENLTEGSVLERMKAFILNELLHEGVCILVGVAVALCAAGEVACAQAPSFVVATIKPAPPDAQGQGVGIQPGRLVVNNWTLKQMLGFAFGSGGLAGIQVSGGPNWIDKDRYMVQGQAEGTPNPAEFRAMLESLLIERFALKTHTESKEINVYNLVLARSDGKLGPKVEKWDGTCPGGRAPQPPAVASPRCGAFFTQTGMNMTCDSMAVLANMLSTPIAGLDRPVVDKTGLSDEYTYQFEYQFPRPGAPGQATSAAPDAAGITATDLLPPALGTALQEQLGVKLQPAKGTTDVLVVDQAQKPSEN
jgi:uncharacterized protein (TIGR03435 family)